MLAAPELVIAEFVELLDKSEVAAELQRGVLADRVMRGEECSEFEAGHGRFLRRNFRLLVPVKLRAGERQGKSKATPVLACNLPAGVTVDRTGPVEFTPLNTSAKTPFPRAER